MPKNKNPYAEIEMCLCPFNKLLTKIYVTFLRFKISWCAFVQVDFYSQPLQFIIRTYFRSMTMVISNSESPNNLIDGFNWVYHSMFVFALDNFMSFALSFEFVFVFVNWENSNHLLSNQFAAMHMNNSILMSWNSYRFIDMIANGWKVAIFTIELNTFGVRTTYFLLLLKSHK